MDQCPVCAETLRSAVVICSRCGSKLPVQIVVVSEGSHGGGFAIVTEERGYMADEDKTANVKTIQMRRALTDDE